MSDYIRSLEEQNEQLKEKLAIKQAKLPEWVCIKGENDVVTWAYMLEDRMFGYVEYLDVYDNMQLLASPGGKSVYGKTKLSNFSHATLVEAKRLVEQEYDGMFLSCGRP